MNDLFPCFFMSVFMIDAVLLIFRLFSSVDPYLHLLVFSPYKLPSLSDLQTTFLPSDLSLTNLFLIVFFKSLLEFSAVFTQHCIIFSIVMSRGVNIIMLIVSSPLRRTFKFSSVKFYWLLWVTLLILPFSIGFQFTPAWYIILIK